ncbi:MAG: helix-turn-helix domain-containing protein [Rhodospirillales bacterium]|nr:helix-turn-helix domain-containing protein [Rhodospirillales bacterium]
MGSPDWHPEDIKAAIRKTGTNLVKLALANQYSEVAVRMTLRRQWPAVEAIIGAKLGIAPHMIWPSRYRPDGTPKRKRIAPAERLKALAEEAQRQNGGTP